MKIKPEPVSVEDVSEHDEKILHNKRTAARVRKLSSASQNTAQRTVYGRSIYKGPLEDAIASYDGLRPLTIFSSSHDQSPEHNEVKGHCFRKVFFKDEIEVLDSSAKEERNTQVKLTVFVPNQDESKPDPKINVEQRRYRGGQEITVVQQLIFGGSKYVFKGCGDEEMGVGKRDLYVRFCSLEQNMFDDYIKQAKYYGYDRNENISIGEKAFRNGLSYSFTSPNIGANLQRLCCDISFDGGELRSLLAARRPRRTSSGDYCHQVTELITMKLQGFGLLSEDKVHVGTLNLRIS